MFLNIFLLKENTNLKELLKKDIENEKMKRQHFQENNLYKTAIFEFYKN